MTLISFFTSLINIGTEWYMTAIYAVCLFFEGIVFEGVTVVYNLFLLVCSINLSTVSGLLSSLIDRLKALIIVFIVFKLGVSLIGYLLEPDKAQKEGTKIIVNIFITAVLLISYSTIFDIFNELNLLILGNPTKYPYTVLSTIANVTPEENDKGLIMRLVFGDQSNELDDVGEFLSYSTLTMFIYDYGNPSSSNNVSAIICPSTGENGCDFKKLVNANSKINLTIEYHPVFGFLVGLFLIYSIGSSAISVGIRMFKLVILQLLAPIAIVTILDGGIKADVFQKFIKKYIEVYLSAMLRLLATLVITIFLCKFIVNIGDYAALNDSGDKWMNILLGVIVIWAGFKFMKDAPAFIESIIGAKLGAGDKTGFGELVGGIIGGAVGGIAGIVGGAATGFASGSGLGRFTGAVGNALAGGVGGISAGAKGKKVSDKIKNLQGNAKAYTERAAKMGMIGGGLTYGWSKLEAPIADIEQRNFENATAAQNYLEGDLSARANILSDIENTDGFRDAKGDLIKYGKDMDSFASKAVAGSQKVRDAQGAYDRATIDSASARAEGSALDSSLSAADMAQARAKYGFTGNFGDAGNENAVRKYLLDERDATRERVEKDAKEAYQRALMTNATVNGHASVKEADRQYNRFAPRNEKIDDIRTSGANNGYKKAIKNQQDQLAIRVNNTKYKGAFRRRNRMENKK